MKRLLFDTESDGLLEDATKIHCIAAVDVDTGETWDFKPTDPYAKCVEVLDSADVLIGHNIMRHDVPLMEKVWGWKINKRILDTMIIARLEYPNLQGHTLKAWGERLGTHKGDYAEIKRAEALAQGIKDEKAILRYVWGQWNEEMHAYMVQDRDTNLALWRHLNPDSYSQEAIELEHRIARVCNLMEKSGVPFDTSAAGLLHTSLIEKRDAIEKQLIEKFGFWYAPISPTNSIFTPKRDNAKQGYVANCPCTKLKLVRFNPGSRDHIAKVLLGKGWKPEKFTPSGKPEINEETVASIILQYPEMEGLGEYLMISKRLGQLAEGKQAWLTQVDGTGYIHGAINPMGTATSRASHFRPNLAQVPKVGSPYGAECRSLFYARQGWKLIGADMSGLELRGFAHYLAPLDGGKYANAVVDGDPHWLHTQYMGLTENPEQDPESKLDKIIRNGSKTFIYGFIYGCGNRKAGNIIFDTCLQVKQMTGDRALLDKFFPHGPSEAAFVRVGKKVRGDFTARLKGLWQLRDKLDHYKPKGYLPGLDGRRIPIESEHSMLNYVIQSCGAILCKRWVCDAFDAMEGQWKHGWDGDFVFGLWVHDEVQVWVKEGLEEEAATILTTAAQNAGVPYGFRVRLDSEAKVGRTWAETH